MNMTLKLINNLANGAPKMSRNRKTTSKSIKNQGNTHLFFYYRGVVVVHHKYVPQGQTANMEYYMDLMAENG